MATFKYINSNLRIGDKSATHRTSRSITWKNHTEEVWSEGNWATFKNYVENNCRGDDQTAMLIERVLNTLNKYTGVNAQTQLTRADANFLGIRPAMEAALVESLNNLSLGSSGTARSLLNYVVTDKGVSTAQNAGFSFESRLSEFIQRLSGKQDFNTLVSKRTLKSGKRKGQTETIRIDPAKSLRTGAKAVSVGSSFRNVVMPDIDILYQDIINGVGDQVAKEVTQSSDDMLKLGYKVPDKADISVPANISIYADYGPTIQRFLEAIRGARFSLKNTSQKEITIGSTKDPTRLRGFADLFLRGRGYNFAGLCSFVFASKNSDNETVQRYTDWGRIFYELMGAGQFQNNTFTLVDYLIINSYTPDGKDGYVRVYSMKSLVKNAPMGESNPPFKIFNKGGEKYPEHAGSVEVDLTQLPKSFLITS